VGKHIPLKERRMGCNKDLDDDASPQ